MTYPVIIIEDLYIVNIPAFQQSSIITGILPEVEEYFVRWPDLDALSDMEQAEILAKKIEAFSKYVAGGVDQLIPPEEFLTMMVGMEVEEVEQIMDAALEREEEMAAEEEEREIQRQAELERQAQIELESAKAQQEEREG